MNAKLTALAAQAGFMFWEDETWNPGDVIDWGARYDDELQQLFKLMLEECANVCKDVGTREQDSATGQMYADAILEHFQK